MRLYVNNISIYRSDAENIEIKKELKQKYQHDPRRQDSFMLLGLLGAYRLGEVADFSKYDELYITSGIGNTDVLQTTHKDVIKDGHSIKPFDLINMLGNTSSYYIAKSLNIRGKAIFQISDNFTYINSLISLYASISVSANNAIIGTIDLVKEPDEVCKRVLGINKSTEVTSCVSFQYLSLTNDKAIAAIEFDGKTHSLSEVQELLKDTNKNNINIQVSIRCKKLTFEKPKFFLENMASYAINIAIQKQQDLLFVDCFEDKYKLIKLINLF